MDNTRVGLGGDNFTYLVESFDDLFQVDKCDFFGGDSLMFIHVIWILPNPLFS